MVRKIFPYLSLSFEILSVLTRCHVPMRCHPGGWRGACATFQVSAKSHLGESELLVPSAISRCSLSDRDVEVATSGAAGMYGFLGGSQDCGFTY